MEGVLRKDDVRDGLLWGIEKFEVSTLSLGKTTICVQDRMVW